MGDLNRIYINSESGETSDRPSPVAKKDTNAAPEPSHREGYIYKVEIPAGGGEWRESLTVKNQQNASPGGAPAQDRPDPLDKVVSVYGSRVSRADISPDDAIDFLGDRMPAKALVAAGLLDRDASGYKWSPEGLKYLQAGGISFKDAAPASNSTTPAVSNTNAAVNTNTAPMNEVQADAYITEVLAKEVDFTLPEEATAVVQDLGAKVSDAPLQALVMAFAENKLESVASLTEEIARVTGESAEAMAAKTMQVVDAMLERAKIVTVKAGLDAEEFDAFSAWLEGQPERQREVRMAFTERNASPLVKAARDFANSDVRYSQEEWDTAVIYNNGKPVAGKVAKIDGKYVVLIDGLPYPMGRVSRVKE